MAVDCRHPHLHPFELLHSLTPAGLPPHELVLNVNMPVKLLLDMNPAGGLAAGASLVVRVLHERSLDCEVAAGPHAGRRVFIPRVDLRSTEHGLPFTLKRRQFPLRPACESRQQQGQQHEDARASASQQQRQRRAEAALQQHTSQAEELPDELDSETVQMLAEIDLMMASRTAPSDADAGGGVPPCSGPAEAQGASLAAPAAVLAGPPIGIAVASATAVVSVGPSDDQAASSGLKDAQGCQLGSAVLSAAVAESPGAWAAAPPNLAAPELAAERISAPADLGAAAQLARSAAGASQQLGSASGVCADCRADDADDRGDADWDAVIAAPPAGPREGLLLPAPAAVVASNCIVAQHPAIPPEAGHAGKVGGHTRPLAEELAGLEAVASKSSATATTEAAPQRCSNAPINRLSMHV